MEPEWLIKDLLMYLWHLVVVLLILRAFRKMVKQFSIVLFYTKKRLGKLLLHKKFPPTRNVKRYPKGCNIKFNFSMYANKLHLQKHCKTLKQTIKQYAEPCSQRSQHRHPSFQKPTKILRCSHWIIFQVKTKKQHMLQYWPKSDIWKW